MEKECGKIRKGEEADTSRFRDAEHQHEYYKEPVMCLLSIKDFVDAWEKRGGPNGYFDFIEQHMGAQINDDKMNFSVMVGKDGRL